MGVIPDGEYTAMRDAVSLLSQPEATEADYLKAKEILGSAQSQGLPVAETVSELLAIFPHLHLLIADASPSEGAWQAWLLFLIRAVMAFLKFLREIKPKSNAEVPNQVVITIVGSTVGPIDASSIRYMPQNPDSQGPGPLPGVAP